MMNWRTVYGYFARWRDDGLWDRLLKSFAKHAKGKVCFIDSSYVKVHRSGSNPAAGQSFQAMGKSRGGLTTKIHALVDGKGRAVRLVLSAGNEADNRVAPRLLQRLRETPFRTVVADKGYDDDKLRVLLFEEGIFPCFSATSKRTEPRPFHRGYYRRRHLVENCFCDLKKQRRVSTRYDKLASSYLAFVSIAAILNWIS